MAVKITIVDGIIKKDNKILLLKKQNKDYYEFPGGKVEKDESLKDCLKRELKEEIGIKPTKWKKIQKINLKFENKQITDHGYLIQEYEGKPEIKEKEIFEKLVWKTKEEIKKTRTAPNIMPLLRKLA